MATYSGVIPLFQKCRLLGNVPLLLDDSITVRSLKTEHVGAIITKRKALSDRLGIQNKCILMAEGEVPFGKAELEDVALCGTFVLNVFSEDGAAVVGPAFSIRHAISYKVEDVHDINAHLPQEPPKYRIGRDTNPSLFRETYKSARAALAKDKTLRISLRKFNSSVLKPNVEDRILDMSICLESMTRLESEISFRFSLYNSLLAEAEPKKRRDSFAVLKKLYGERSNIVHGNREANAKWLEDNWGGIVRVAKLAILKKIEFLQSHHSEEWQPHLDGLAFGEKT